MARKTIQTDEIDSLCNSLNEKLLEQLEELQNRANFKVRHFAVLKTLNDMVSDILSQTSRPNKCIEGIPEVFLGKDSNLNKSVEDFGMKDNSSDLYS